MSGCSKTKIILKFPLGDSTFEKLKKKRAASLNCIFFVSGSTMKYALLCMYPLCQCCDDIIRLLYKISLLCTTSEVHFSSGEFLLILCSSSSGIISTNDVKENNGSIVTQSSPILSIMVRSSLELAR